jgi:hypothetical protein
MQSSTFQAIRRVNEIYSKTVGVPVEKKNKKNYKNTKVAIFLNHSQSIKISSNVHCDVMTSPSELHEVLIER